MLENNKLGCGRMLSKDFVTIWKNDVSCIKCFIIEKGMCRDHIFDRIRIR